MKALTSIDELAALERGWLDGEGEKITQDSLDLARGFVSSLNIGLADSFAVFPSEDGSLQFELEPIPGAMLGVELGPTQNDMVLWSFASATDEYREDAYTDFPSMVNRLSEILLQPSG